MFNYSFWADEAFVSGIAAQLVMGKMTILHAFETLPYQKLYIVVLAFFFKMFGISEFVARLPSILAFLLGIVVIFLLSKKLSNVYGGVLSAFLYGFSHLNLAYATQAKPYSLIETILLCVVLIALQLKGEKNIRRLMQYHISIILHICIAMFLHTIGVLLWIVYFVFIASSLKKFKIPPFKRINPLIIIFSLFAIFLIFIVVLPYFSIRLFPYNNSYQVIKLFSYKYSLIGACAVLGSVWSFKRNKVLSTALLLYSCILLILATFQQYIFNIRYVLTFFGILFMYFGIFWAKVGERYDNNLKFKIFNFKLSGKALIPIVVLILIYISGYKIVRWPQAYYNPNIDKYGDVQIANYKVLFRYLSGKLSTSTVVFSDIADVDFWYSPNHMTDATFVKESWNNIGYGNIGKNPMNGKPVYTTLDQFKTELKKYPKGYMIVEDWQSFLPDEIKEYVKKNLHLEYRVESLKEAPDDPWPLALYSWGLEKQI